MSHLLLGRTLRRALLLVPVWMLPVSHARAYEVCLDIPLSAALVDASPEGMLDYGEDRGRDEGANPFPLQRWLYRVVDHDQSNKVLAGWAPLDSNGCTEDFDRDGATSVDIRYFPWAYFSDSNNSVVAYDCTSMPDCTLRPEIEVDIDVSSESQARVTIPDPEVGPSFEPWLTALWAASFAEQQFSPRQDSTAYLLVDFNAVLFGATASDRLVGGQPTTVFSGSGYRGKWNVAHEYGHLVSIIDPIPALLATDYDCSLNGPSHGFTTIEYHSCAAPEGFANFFSAAVWSDVGTDTTANLPYGLLQGGAAPFAQSQQIGGAAFCQPCGPGTATERDWASALLELAQQQALDVNYVLAMLAQAYPWPSPSALNGAFWGDFDTAMTGYLTIGEKSTWDNRAAAKGIDQ
jgi:hypothetical protein